MPSLARSVLPALLLAALLPAVTSVTGAIGAVAARGAAADETTTSQDNLRTGWDPDEPELTPASVSGRTPGYTFGQVFRTAVTGQVYAQPLVIGSTVIVATEQDDVYGLDASTGAVQWQTSLGTPYVIPNCTDLAPDIGVTGGPVYDPATGDVYLVAQTVPKTAPSYHLFGINPATGAVVFKEFLGGRPSNDPDITLNAADQLERPGLLLLNGWVYAAFGSHCDHSPWTGFVNGVNVSTRASTEWGDETGVTDNEAGIWQGGGGLMSDGPGRIIVSTGNGVSPPPGPGTRPPGQLGDSVVRLAVNSNGTLSAKDFFSPVNAPALDAGDTDYGSGGPVGLPFGTSQYPHVLAQAGKDGRIFLLNRDDLGGREQGRGHGDDALSVTQPYNGQWGHPAAFGGTPTLTAANQGHASDYLYYIGRDDSLRMLKAGVNKSGEPRLADVASSSVVFGFSSGSPVVTSTGPHINTGVVWAVYSSGITGSNGALEAFAANPGGTCTAAAPCTISPIWSAPIGTASQFTTVATTGGMVYVGTRDGAVYGFGDTAAAALAPAAPATLPATPVGSASASRDVTVTARSDVTVTGVSADTTAVSGGTQFRLGQVTETTPGGTAAPVSFPVTLHRGDQLTAPVTFHPAAPGGVAGAVSFHARPAPGPRAAHRRRRHPRAVPDPQPGAVRAGHRHRRVRQQRPGRGDRAARTRPGQRQHARRDGAVGAGATDALLGDRAARGGHRAAARPVGGDPGRVRAVPAGPGPGHAGHHRERRRHRHRAADRHRAARAGPVPGHPGRGRLRHRTGRHDRAQHDHAGQHRQRTRRGGPVRRAARPVRQPAQRAARAAHQRGLRRAGPGQVHPAPARPVHRPVHVHLDRRHRHAHHHGARQRHRDERLARPG